VVVAAVATVAVEVPAVAPVILTELGLKVTVGGLVAPEGPLTDAAKATLPVKPFEGVTVMTEVFPVVAPWANIRDAGLALRLMFGATVTVTLTGVVPMIFPVAASVPVTVTT